MEMWTLKVYMDIDIIVWWKVKEYSKYSVNMTVLVHFQRCNRHCFQPQEAAVFSENALKKGLNATCSADNVIATLCQQHICHIYLIR